MFSGLNPLIAAISALLPGIIVGYLLRLLIVSRRTRGAESKAQQLVSEAKSKSQDILIEAKNQAESLIYVAEKSLRESGDKVPAEVKQGVEAAAAALKGVKDKDDAEAIRARTGELSRELQKIGEAVYKGTNAGPSPDPAPAPEKNHSTHEPDPGSAPADGGGAPSA